jgi:nucleoside-diphosphate-sugar epimerase
MRVAIAGAHGQIALRLTARLAARGDTVIGLIRNPDHAEDVRAVGGDPVLCDLEQATVEDVATAISGSDAVVFAAGAGGGSGAARKLTVDRDGAVKLLEAATEAGVPRYLIVSSVGAENPPGDDDVFSVYLRAKAEADAALVASDRDWTIVRPGGLTDDPGTDLVRIDLEPFRGRIPREDVAAVFEALLHDVPVSRQIFYLNGGDSPILDRLEEVSATTGD